MKSKRNLKNSSGLFRRHFFTRCLGGKLVMNCKEVQGATRYCANILKFGDKFLFLHFHFHPLPETKICYPVFTVFFMVAPNL